MLAEVSGVRIRYEIDGVGPAVILLHGWGGALDSMRPVIHCLSRGFQVIALDLPGFGQSTLPSSTWGVHDYAQCVAEFLGAIECPGAHVVGHSFGGRVGICLAVDRPSVVDRLVLIDSSGIQPARTWQYHFNVRSMKIARGALRLIPAVDLRARALAWLYRSVGSSDYRTAGPIRNIMVRVINEDLRPILSSVHARSLLIWGEKDLDVPVAHGEIMAREIPDARLEILPGAGHFAYMDRLPQCCQLIRDFLKEA
jgi:pimeloyl-ACP methyl ester carboxylesterase